MEQAFLERLEERDSAVFALSDTLDMKASIALVVVVFLADQSGGLLSGEIAAAWWWAQAVNCGLLATAGGLALAAMWPRDHDSEDILGWSEWIDRLRANNAGDPNGAARSFYEGRVEGLRGRIESNSAICTGKGNLVHWAFRGSAIALIVNLVTLVFG